MSSSSTEPKKRVSKKRLDQSSSIIQPTIVQDIEDTQHVEIASKKVRKPRTKKQEVSSDEKNGDEKIDEVQTEKKKPAKRKMSETKEKKEKKEKKPSDDREAYSSIAGDAIIKPPGKEWVMAIDPGKVNFAFIIEEIDSDAFQAAMQECPAERDRFQRVPEVNVEKVDNVENDTTPPKKKKRKTGGKKRGADMVPTEPYSKFLDQFYHCGRTILCANHSLDVPDTVKKRGSRCLSAGVFLQLTDMFDRYRPYLDHCSTIVIEQQMSFGSRINTMAIKIAQHAYSYFLFRYGNAKTIVEFPSYNKTQLLGAPAGLAKPQRKKWAVEKANAIWTLRGDLDASGYVTSKRKKDDMSDCLLHVLAYLISR